MVAYTREEDGRAPRAIEVIPQSIRNKPIKDLTFWEQAVLTLHAARFANCDAPDLAHTINHVDNLIASIDKHRQESGEK